MTNFYLNNPEWLFGLILIPLVILLIFLAKSLRRKPKVPFSSVPLLNNISTKKSWFGAIVKYLMLSLVFLLLILALTDPRATTTVEKSKGTTILVIDISYSMAATDMNPTRIDVLKNNAIDLVNNLPSESRVGLIFFAGNVVVKHEPTDEKAKIIASLNQLSVDSLESYTATGDALQASLNLLEQYQKENVDENGDRIPGVVVLFTDGERTWGVTEKEVLPSFVAKKIQLFTVGIGSDQEVEIKIPDPLTGEIWTSMISPLNDTLLEEIATTTGASYFRAKDMQSFEEIVDKVKETGLTYSEVEEVNLFSYLVAPAGLVLVLLLSLFLI